MIVILILQIIWRTDFGAEIENAIGVISLTKGESISDFKSIYDFTEQWTTVLIVVQTVAVGLSFTKLWPHSVAWSFCSTFTFIFVRLVGRWKIPPPRAGALLL